MKYFTEVLHEVPYKQDEVFPYGTLYEYVASWVLDGIVNYPEHVAGAVLAQYSEGTDVLSFSPSSQTVQELRKKVLAWNKEEDVWCGSLYELFDDNVALLSYEEETDAYWLFLYDCDSSDCSIGRFKTTDSREEVLNEFEEYLEFLAWNSWIPLNVKRLNSWVKW